MCSVFMAETCVVLSRLLFVLLSFFFLPLCCLTYFVLSDLLLFTTSDYPVGIFNFFLHTMKA